MCAFCTKICGEIIAELVILTKFGAPGSWAARTKIKAEVSLGLPGGIHAGFPHTSAILGSPTLALANLCEVLGDSSAVLLGLGVADFVKVHHSYYLFRFFVP